MPTYSSYDDVQLAYDLVGEGPPLVVIPGGPAGDPAYLGDLEPLAQATSRRLVVVHARGAGRSDVAVDPASYAVDRIAEDVRMLTDHLGLVNVELLAHSAGTSVAMLFAAAHPERVARLLLVSPSLRALGYELSDDEWEASAVRRSDEPWYALARAGWTSDEPTPEEETAANAFSYGRWDDAAQTHAATYGEPQNGEAARAFYPGGHDVERTLAALRSLEAPVRILLGGIDLLPTPAMADELAGVFRDATVTVQDDAGHFPWVDDQATFVRLVARLVVD